MFHQLLSLILLTAPHAISACQSHVSKPPLLWLADLRAGSAHIDSDVTPSLGEAPGRRLIRFEEGATPIPVSLDEKLELEKSGLRYFDVTEVDVEVVFRERIANDRSSLANRAIPSAPTHQAQVKPVIATLSQANLKTDLAELTSYKTRYYKSATGASSANALLAKLQTIASSAPGTGGAVSVSSFAHTWGMPSIIAKIAGTNASGAITIVGAHLDSINQANPASGVSAGADDNGSGCVNLIEAFRKLVAAGFKPTNPVEFHWYSGEEAGLLGSAAVSTSYSKANKAINAYMNLDMTAWLQTGTTPQIGFVSDRTNAGLTTFTKKLVPEYLSGVIATTDSCGYACSDHASWNSLGYAAVYPFESITQYENPNIHTATDTSTSVQFSFAHAHEFTKLVVAFLMELAL
ncbi:hypothetical protein M408DRAFT_333314 [Serendipita vermifera MAFF 305830]|uniref:Peptide hydrolase n=1 Tax=Serendipita vermifera MAFF 305830 TaxID=933852 RepID=A0A0C3AR25_SERVB|nr:hypothetical protein M408DRAFT_333314 [Serendipita vermifera MAFF 305830]